MKDNIQELEDNLLAAEILHDSDCDKSAYFTLRRAVLDYFGMTQEELNGKVLELEGK